MREPKPVTWESFAAAAVLSGEYYAAPAVHQTWVALHDRAVARDEIDEDP